MDDERLKKAIDFAKQATEKDIAGDYPSAFELYKTCLDHWHLVCKYQTNPVLKERLYKKMEPYIERAENIKTYLESLQTVNEHSSQLVNDQGNETNKTILPQDTQNQLEDQKLYSRLASTIITERPKIKWDDIAGLHIAKESLQEAVTLPTRFPNLFIGERKPWKGILLYGPPGTGKTQLAKACAAESCATFLSVSSADLVSKWQGESEKLVRGLFELARQRSPSVIFIDEVDSLCGARNDREGESSRRIKTEFLIQMEGLDTQQKTNSSQNVSNRILILGATNEPWALDAAIRRRFERRIYIPLPDVSARQQLIRLHIGNTPHSLTENDMKDLAIRTHGYSGADISVLVRDALFEPVRTCRTATHFKRIYDKTNQPYWTPCSPEDLCASKEKRNLMSIPGPELLPAELTMADFNVVLTQAKPSVSLEEVMRHQEWTKQFGVECQ